MDDTEVPIHSENERMRRHIDHLNRESDYDSEYANHPPPTDSEIEIEFNPSFLRNRIGHTNSINNINNCPMEPLPEYVTDDNAILPNRNNRAPANRISYRSNNRNNLHNNSSSNLLNEAAPVMNTTNNLDINNVNNSRLLFGLGSTAMEDLYKQRNRLKNYGLKRLNASQHILVTICRDLPIYSILKNFIVVLNQWYKLIKNPYNNVITVRATEFFLASLWCLVSALLSYTILDGLMVRWMVVYDIQAVIVRILSMSLIIIMIIEIFNYTFNNIDNEFCLTVWILISCVLTIIFIVQCFVSNNLMIEAGIKRKKDRELSSTDLRNRSSTNINNYVGNYNDNSVQPIHARHGSISSTNSNNGVVENNNINTKKYIRKVDYYNLIVFAVVPIGVASFISTLGLVRLLLILRLDVGMEISRIQQGV